MTATRPGAAVPPARPQWADRDEYPAMGDVAVPTTGTVIGPAPHVHLAGLSILATTVTVPVRTGRSPMSPLLPYSVPTPQEPPRFRSIMEDVEQMPAADGRADAPLAAMAADDRHADSLIAEAPQWKPVDPQTARAVLHVEREVEIPGARRHARRPRSPELSSGDIAERVDRLVILERRRRVVMVAVAAVVALALLGSVWRYASRGYAAPATTWNQVAVPDPTLVPTASPSVSASASVSPAPPSMASATPTGEVTAIQATPAPTTSRISTVLSANAIYGSAISGSCPEQAKPTNTDEAKAALSADADCMNAVWEPIIEAGKMRFRPASINFYVNTIVNPCATLRTSDPVTAMYCPLDATIYISPSGVSSAIENTFYAAELVTHEYAHHVQSLTQILTKAHEQGWSDNEYSRRIQLQAHCLSFAVMTHVDGFSPDLATFRLGWQVGPGSETYGSVASIQYWGEKGVAATTIGACDTYSVPASAVA